MTTKKKILIALLLVLGLVIALLSSFLTAMTESSEEVGDNFAINQVRRQLLLYHDAYAVLPPDIDSLIIFVGLPQKSATPFRRSVYIEYSQWGSTVEIKPVLYNPHADLSNIDKLSNLVAASPVVFGGQRRVILLTEKNKNGECLVKEKISERLFCEHWQYDYIWQLERKK